MIPKITVIIPVYNVEEYISDCLNSVINQKLEGLEVVIIDDGSTDNSFTICEEFASKYTNLHIYSQENRGLGFTRNRGVELSKGEYIAFLDADDYVPVNIYQELYSVAKKTNSDIILGQAWRFNSNSGKLYKPYGSDILFSNDVKNKKVRDIPYVVHNGIVANKLYKSALIKDKKIRFVEGVHYEDTPFSLAAYNYADSVTVFPNIVYFWRVRERTDNPSISQQVHTLKNLKDRITVNNLCDRMLDLPKELEEEWNFFKYNNILNSFLSDVSKINPLEEKCYKGLINEYLRTMPEIFLNRLSDQNRIRYVCTLENKYDFINPLDVKKFLAKYKNGKFYLNNLNISSYYQDYLDISNNFIVSCYIDYVRVSSKKIRIGFTLILRTDWIENNDLEIRLYLNNYQKGTHNEILISKYVANETSHYSSDLLLTKEMSFQDASLEMWYFSVRINYREFSKKMKLNKFSSSEKINIINRSFLGSVLFRSNSNGNFYLIFNNKRNLLRKMMSKVINTIKKKNR